jgi:hypothetical protein
MERQEQGVGMSGEWVEVMVTYDPVEGEIIKDLLESGGIAVRLVSLKVGPYPVNIGRMGEVKVMVMEKDRETALKAMEEFKAGQ